MLRDMFVQSAFTVARSLVLLGQPLRALDRVELVIFDAVGSRIGPRN